MCDVGTCLQGIRSHAHDVWPRLDIRWQNTSQLPSLRSHPSTYCCIPCNQNMHRLLPGVVPVAQHCNQDNEGTYVYQKYKAKLSA
eukprot:4170059-Karenia_brevis.AAC.1